MFPFPVDSEHKPVQLLTTLDNSEVDLLILEYIKVCTIPSILIDTLLSYIFKFFSPYCGLCICFRLTKLALSSRLCTKIQSSSLR